jgi:ABC-type lipoprotein export system ATPase subunit
MITHEAEIGQHAKRTVRIKDGRVVADAPVTERLFAGEVLKTMPAVE